MVGVAFGAYVLAAVEVGSSPETSGSWVDAVSFGLIFLVLLVRPAGVSAARRFDGMTWYDSNLVLIQATLTGLLLALRCRCRCGWASSRSPGVGSYGIGAYAGGDPGASDYEMARRCRRS